MTVVSEVEVLLKLRQEGAESIDLFSGKLDDLGDSGDVASRGADKVTDATKKVGTQATATSVSLNTLDRATKSSGDTAVAQLGKFGQFRAGLNEVAEVAGYTFANLGLMGSGLAVASAALAGWQIGTVIDQLTGASTAIEHLTVSLFDLSSATQAAGIKQDVLDRASKAVARTVTDYGEAIKIVTQLDAIRLAQFDKSAAVQRRAVDAELALGRITIETANALRAGIATDEQAAGVRLKRLTVTDSLKESERLYREDLKATNTTEAELLNLLRTNAVGFANYSKEVGLHDSTVQRLKETLKGEVDQRKKSQKALEEEAKAREKARVEVEKERQALEQLGIVTESRVNDQLADFLVLESRARAEGVDLNATLRAMLPTLEDLYHKAVQSGVGVTQAREAFERAKKANDDYNASIKAIDWNGQLAQWREAAGVKRGELIPLTETEAQKTGALADAYKVLGVTSRKELHDTATAAIFAYNTIKASGTATPKEIEIAHKQAIAAIKAANGELPSQWATEIVPGIKRQLGLLGDAVSGSLAQMLLGSKSFADGWTDIWQSMKKSALNVFNEIANAFIGGMLKRMIASLAGVGGGGGFSFAGLAQSALGIGGTGVGTAGVAGAAGTTSATSVATSLAGTGAAGAGAGGGSAGAGFLASGLGTALGGVGIGGAGFGLGYFLSEKFGKTAGAIGGAGGGAATGALIGTAVFPGIGTGLGALIGGGAGLIGGLLGGGDDGDKSRDKFISSFGGKGTGEGSGFANLAGQLASVGRNDLFKILLDADSEKKAVGAVQAIAKVLQEETTRANEAAAATKAKSDIAIAASQAELDARKAQMGELQTQIDELGKQRQGLVDSIANEAPEEVIGVVEAQTRARIAQIDAETDAKQQQLEDAKRASEEAFAEIERIARETAESIRTEFGRGVTIPVTYDDRGIAQRGNRGPLEGGYPTLPDADNGGGEPPVAAAKGITANRPTLALFGEGGETEVGGPRAFFRDVFASLGVGTGNAGGGEQVPNVSVVINTISADGLSDVVHDELIPAIYDAWRFNRRGARTDARALLGTS